MAAGYTLHALSRDPLPKTIYGLALNAAAYGQAYRVDPSTGAATALGTPYHSGSFAAGPDGCYAKANHQYAYSGSNDITYDQGVVSATNQTNGNLPIAQAAVLNDASSSPTDYEVTERRRNVHPRRPDLLAGPAAGHAVRRRHRPPAHQAKGDFTEFLTGPVFDTGTNANDYNLYLMNISSGATTKIATLARALHGLSDFIQPPPYFVVSGIPSAVTAGARSALTVTAFNGDGTVNTGYAGTVHFASTDPNALLPADAAPVNGVGSFNATLAMAGAQSITATDIIDPALAITQAAIIVQPGLIARHVVSHTSPAGGDRAGNPPSRSRPRTCAATS